MRRKIRRYSKNRVSMISKKKGVFKWLKEHLILSFTIIGVTISAFILVFMFITYETPPDVHCEIDLFQRPDSIFQAQLYIWNEGERIAEDIVIWAKRDNVFQWDTSSNKHHSPLYVYPKFSTFVHINPGSILNDLGKVESFSDHYITIPKLGKSKKEENYLIIGPHLFKLDHYKSLKNSLYRPKFMLLKKIKSVNSYKDDILNNLQVIYEGKSINISIGDTNFLDTHDINSFIYPTYEQFIDYRTKAKLPNNILMPKNKIIKMRMNGGKSDGRFLLY